MPAAYKIFLQHNLVVTKFSDVVTTDEYFRVYRELVRDPLFDKSQREISDYSETQKALFGMSEISALARDVGLRYSDQGVSTAIVADSDLGFGLARMYQAFADVPGAETVMVFRSYQEAFDWLELDGVSTSIMDLATDDCPNSV